MITSRARAPSLADRAYAEIRAMILDLRLLPGESILVEDLAARLGMSRTPVREAIARLSSGVEALVAAVPRKGIVVTVPTVEAMRELYEIVDGLESEAVKLAVQRADGNALAALDQSVADQEFALATDDLVGWTQADRRFHGLLFDAAGNRRLRDLMRLFDDQLHRVRVATIHLRHKPLESTREHRAVIAAIRARDARRAQEVHAAHRERALQEMTRAVADYAGLVLRAAAGSSTRTYRLNDVPSVAAADVVTREPSAEPVGVGLVPTPQPADKGVGTSPTPTGRRMASGRVERSADRSPIGSAAGESSAQSSSQEDKELEL